MGRTYHSIKNKKLSFDVNFSGADILGYTAKAVDEHLKDEFFNAEWKAPSTAFKTTKEDCLRIASKLEVFILDTKKVNKTFKLCKNRFDCDSDVNSYIEFIKEWIEFLKTCNGYEVMS